MLHHCATSQALQTRLCQNTQRFKAPRPKLLSTSPPPLLSFPPCAFPSIRLLLFSPILSHGTIRSTAPSSHEVCWCFFVMMEPAGDVRGDPRQPVCSLGIQDRATAPGCLGRQQGAPSTSRGHSPNLSQPPISTRDERPSGDDNFSLWITKRPRGNWFRLRCPRVRHLKRGEVISAPSGYVNGSWIHKSLPLFSRIWECLLSDLFANRSHGFLFRYELVCQVELT